MPILVVSHTKAPSGEQTAVRRDHLQYEIIIAQYQIIFVNNDTSQQTTATSTLKLSMLRLGTVCRYQFLFTIDGVADTAEEVCSVDGNLSARNHSSIRKFAIGVPLFLSLKGAVKLADGRTDT